MTYTTKKPNTHTLRVSCPATTGIIAAVTSHLAGRGYYISELSSYDDEDTERFFMRCTFQVPGAAADEHDILGRFFASVADRFGMHWSVCRSDRPKRVLLMVSKIDHCLRDLLYRWESGELNMDIVAVVSNHPTLEPMAARHGIPFHHLPITAEHTPKARFTVPTGVSRKGIEAGPAELERNPRARSARLRVIERQAE